MWLSIIISKTGGISYAVLGLTQTKTIKISRWFYNAAAISVHREPPPAGTVVHVWTRCRALPGVRLPSCTPVSADQESSLTVPCCEDAFPPTCALETGQQRSSSSHWWFIIYGPDSRRKLASFFPWQANISALSLCHWGWMSCSIQDFYLFFFSLQSLIQTINVRDCLSSTTTITKTKDRRWHPKDTPRLLIYHLSSTIMVDIFIGVL